MELFHNLIFGFSVALSLENLLYCFIGVLVGTLSLHGGGESQTVLEYGGMGGAFFRLGRGRHAGPPAWYLGAMLSYTLAPADPPGGVGRDYDYGALHFDLTVVLGA